MFRCTEASISCSNLSATVTYEHADSASSPIRLQLMGGGREPGEPDKYSLDILGPTALKDPGARAVSLGAALLGRPAPALHTTNSCNKLPTLSPSRGWHLPPQCWWHPMVHPQHPTPPLPMPPPVTDEQPRPTSTNSHHHGTSF
jgi:hypothetical protein